MNRGYPSLPIAGVETPIAYLASSLACVPFTQKIWYFDFVAGDDTNDGLTPQTAIKTWTIKPDGSPGEYISRTGTNSFINQTVDFYVKGDMPATDMMTFFGAPGPNFQIRVHGSPVIKRTGTITAKQDRSPGGHPVVSSTDTTPIIITHDGTTVLHNWDVVTLYNHLVNINANSEHAATRQWPITVLSPTTYSLTGSVATGGGAGGATGVWNANQRDEITDSAVTDWTPDALQLLEVQTNTTINYQGNIVSGPTRGWIAKALTGPVRAGMSIMWSRISVPFSQFNPWPGPFPVGATYSILQLPKIGSLYIDPRLATSLINRNNLSYCELIDFTLDFSKPNFALPYFGGWIYQNCSMDYVYAYGIPGAYFMGCLARHLLFWQGYPTWYFGLAGPGCQILGSGILASLGMMMQGPGAFISGDGSAGNGNQMLITNHHGSFGLGIYDCDAPVYIGNGNTLSNESTIYGTGITTSVIHVDQGGRVVDIALYTTGGPSCVAAGATSDLILNNQPTMTPANPVPYALGGGAFTQSYAAAIPITFANMLKSFANGGFEGRVFDPDSPQTSYEMEHP